MALVSDLHYIRPTKLQIFNAVDKPVYAYELVMTYLHCRELVIDLVADKEHNLKNSLHGTSEYYS